MSIALAPAATGSGPRAHRVLAAGVALAGAGLIAVNPVAPSLAEIPQRVGLTSGFEDVFGWSEVLGGAQTNIGDLITNGGVSALADKELTNLGDYAQLLIGTEGVDTWVPSGKDQAVTSGLEGLYQGLKAILFGSTDPDGWLSSAGYPGIAGALQAAVADVEGGNTAGAFSELSNWLLYGLEAVGKPLIPLLGIPDQMLDNFTPLVDGMFSTQDLWLLLGGAVKTVLSPVVGLAYELVDILNNVGTDGIGSLADAPAELVGALLNGYADPGGDALTDGFVGLLTAGGFDPTFTVEPDGTSVLNIVESVTNGGLLGDLLDTWLAEMAYFLGSTTAEGITGWGADLIGDLGGLIAGVLTAF